MNGAIVATSMSIAISIDALQGFFLLTGIGTIKKILLEVLVKSYESKTLNQRRWVRVEGIVGFTSIEDNHLPKIISEKVEPIKPPRDQYLLP